MDEKLGIPVMFIKFNFFCVCVSVVACQSTYMFVAPRTVIPGDSYNIHGQLMGPSTAPVNVKIELGDRNGVVSSNVATNMISDEFSSTMSTFKIPDDLKPSRAGGYKLTVTGTGGLEFKKSKPVNYMAKRSSVFIQTDKAVYKPSQTVNFRVFGISRWLKVIFDKVKVELYDPKGNRINQWSVSEAELRGNGGIYVQKQTLSDYPVLGEWKIKAKLLTKGDTFVEQTFRVDKYVLPKFEVQLDLPTFGRSKETMFNGKVEAKYTFGKPVKGQVDLRIKPKKERFQWKRGKRTSVSKTIEMQFPIDGYARFSVPISQLETLVTVLSGSTLVFEANVTESLTKARQSDNQEVTFYSQPLKLEFPKSLPDTFKPGLSYSAVIKLSQQDGTPPDLVNGDLKVVITEYRYELEPEPWMPWWREDRPWMARRSSIWRPPRPRRRETSKTLPTQHHSINAQGISEFDITVGSDVTKVKINAYYKDVKMKTKSLKKQHSPSESFVQIRQLTKPARVGEPVEFEIKTTSIPGKIWQLVLGRGKLLSSGPAQTMMGKRKIWSLRPTPLMAPRSLFMVYYVRDDGELIADAITVNVEGVFQNNVSIEFNSTTAVPAGTVQLDVTADTGSMVNLLGVDKSALLMGGNNDISRSHVLQELQEYDFKPDKRSRPPPCDWHCWGWPRPVGGADVKDIIEDSGVVVLTDATIYEHREEPVRDNWPRFERMFSPGIAFERRGGGRGGALPGLRMAANMAGMPGRAQRRRMIPRMKAPRMKKFNQPIPSDVNDLAPVQRTRKLFPETWLWTQAKIEDSQTLPSQERGTVSFVETVPDTITSWVATAFAVNPQSGLGLTETGAELQVSLPFFMSVILPYSVVRGEKVIVQVNIHNYSPMPLFTNVILEKSLDFENVKIASGAQTVTSADISRTVTVQPDKVMAVYFPIIPSTIGRTDVKMKAQTPIMADAVNKKLLVEAEGTPREYNKPVLVDLREGSTFSKMVSISFPPRTVQGSQRVKATVIGDLMGPSINNLDKLLKMPYGCGEQNMLNFAPNIFIVKYLEATNNINEKILTKAKDHMETGYQRELTYSHPDGSFSAFGERDSSGSMWLTAFVLKSFVQAKPYIFVDDEVIKKAVAFIIKHQNSDGSYNEPGRVIHKEMQGGSTSGKVSLTSFVLIAVLEARAVEGVASKIAASQGKAVAYLEKAVPQLTDVYEMAIVAYALQLADSAQADTVWQKLDAKAVVEEGTKHWEKEVKPKTAVNPWVKKKGDAVNIEISAYALLALALKNNTADGVPVLKWLTEQRNPHGGFSSTQDTVIALQALADMASNIYSSTYNLAITVSGTGVSEAFTVDNTNALVLQSRELPIGVRDVTIAATGQGMALVQIEVYYNIDDDDQKQSFNLRVTLPRESMNDFEVKVCASWLEQGSSSMAVIEVGSPSGFVPEIDSVVSKPEHKRAELEDRKLILYYDEITPADTCASVTMQRIGLVAGAQPVPVRVYDYYDPSKQVTEFYIPEVIRTSDVCDVCGANCDFCVPVNPNIV